MTGKIQNSLKDTSDILSQSGEIIRDSLLSHPQADGFEEEQERLVSFYSMINIEGLKLWLLRLQREADSLRDKLNKPENSTKPTLKVLKTSAEGVLDGAKLHANVVKVSYNSIILRRNLLQFLQASARLHQHQKAQKAGLSRVFQYSQMVAELYIPQGQTRPQFPTH